MLRYSTSVCRGVLTSVLLLALFSCDSAPKSSDQDTTTHYEEFDNPALDTLVHDEITQNGVLINSFVLDSAMQQADTMLAKYTRWNHHVGMAQVYNNIGLIHLYQNNHDSALAHFDRALQICMESDYEKGFCTSSANMAMIYTGVGKYRTALDLCLPTLEKFIEWGRPDNAGLVAGNIAYYYHRLGKLDSAEHFYELANDLLPDSVLHLSFKKKVFKVQRIRLMCEIGEFEKASEQSISMLDEIAASPYKQEDLIGQVKVCQAMAAMNNRAPSAEVLNLANEGASRLGEFNCDLYFSPVYEHLSRIYQECGDYKQALVYERLNTRVQDSLRDLSNVVRITNYLIEMERRNNKPDTDQASTTDDSTWKAWAYGAVGLIFIGIIGVAWYRRRNQRERERMQAEAEEMRCEAERTKQTLEATTRELTTIIENGTSTTVCMDKAELVTMLRREKLLTKEAAERFRSRFEMVEPGLLFALRSAYPNITRAEERMFCLLRLNFSNEEITGILGVSMHTVKKGRQRLKSRLQLQRSYDLESFIISF